MTFNEVDDMLSPKSSIQSIMSVEERRYIWDLVKQFQGHEVIEVGTAYGGTAILMALAGASRVHTVDNWQCGKFNECMENIDRAGCAEMINVIARDSIEAASMFDDQSMAIVLVDGDHTGTRPYEDLCAYADKVRAGGYLLVDDTKNGHAAIEHGLARWIQEQDGFALDRICHDDAGQEKLRGFRRVR